MKILLLNAKSPAAARVGLISCEAPVCLRDVRHISRALQVRMNAPPSQTIEEKSRSKAELRY